MPQSERELVEQLLEVGNKLASPPSDPDELLSLLDQTEGFLSKVEQSPSESVSNALRPTIKALVAEKLFNQSKMDLKVAVASCITEITRITAPYAPYDDYLMKEIFRMIVDIFEKLNYISSHSYSRRVSILETVANIRSCVMMLDLECDALVLEMFQHFLKTIRPNHTQNVFSSMEAIMTLVLEESEAITPELLSCLLLSVREDNKDILPIARRLVESVINNCAVKLKPYLLALVQSAGASLSDFGCIVASICQENSDVPVQNELNASGGCLIYEAQTHEKELKENLIGSRIEVWWPDDRVFYPGVVDAYDPVSNEHRVVYYDGDVENLFLKDERWKFVEEFSKAHEGQEGDIQSSNVPFKKRGKVKSNNVAASKVANKTTIPTVKNSGGSEARATINLPQKRPFAENETETKRDDPTSADGNNKDQKKPKALECSMGSLQENESAAKEQKTTGRMGISNSPASFQDHSPASTPRRLGQFRDPQDEVLDAFSSVSIISRILVKTTDEQHSAEVAEARNISVNDEEVEDLKAIEAEKRLERERRRKQEPAAIVAVLSPLLPKAFLYDDVQVDLSERIFDCAFMKKIRIFCQIIENKWYEINTEPLTNYAELADEFGRNAAFDHGNLFKATRQFPHYRGLDASETEAREDLWYELPLVFEGLHKSFQSQKYLQKNIETIRRWFTKLAQAGFDISVPLAAFYLLTVTPTDFKKFRESLNSVSLQLNEERLNVETLKSKLPVTERMAELDSKIEDVKKQLRDLESERMSLDQLKGVELELEKYGTTVKARRLEKLKVLYEKEIQEAESFLREVSLDGFLELTELTSLAQ